MLVALVVYGLVGLSSGNPAALLTFLMAAWLGLQTYKLHEMVKAGEVERYALFTRNPAASDLVGSRPSPTTAPGFGGFGRVGGKDRGDGFHGVGGFDGDGGAGGGAGGGFDGGGLLVAVILALAVVPL